MAFKYRGRTVGAKTPVRSKAGFFLFFVDNDGFIALAKQAIVKMDGNERKIHALQLTVELQEYVHGNDELRDPQIGNKLTFKQHVGGMYYIHQLKHIPNALQSDFQKVWRSIEC